MNLNKVAVLPSKGIGDALMMMVASHRLHCLGFSVTTFSGHLLQLCDWFEGHDFAVRPSIEELETALAPFDYIVFQHENTPFAKALITLHQEKKIKTLSILYAIYEPHKHPPLTPLDRVFNEKKPMVDNIARAIASLLGLSDISKNNGLLPPESLLHRRYKNRVLLHPTSSDPKRNWPAEKFLKIARCLHEEGFYPVFTVSPEEFPHWNALLQGEFELPQFSSLADLACYAYEVGYLIGNDSGVGHLCSNLQIPTLILSNRKRHMSLWRPAWYRGEITTPPTWVPNFKKYRWREHYWHFFIHPARVMKKFKVLISKETF